MDVLTQALGSLGFDWRIALANLVNFLIIFFVLKHFFFGSVQKAIAERKAKIEKGLSDAKEAESLLASSETEKARVLKEAALSAQAIVSSGEEKALVLAADLHTKAEKEAEEIIAKAHKKQAELSAISDKEIQKIVPALAAQMVEKILLEKMTASENEQYIKRILTK
ncbi:MAG: F0F1-type synthase subunit b, F-type H+-transporting ATPase subunit b [Candidatus Parcubacteria bacterium]|jgi:F-type H+-transporting ATPase subunit b